MADKTYQFRCENWDLAKQNWHFEGWESFDIGERGNKTVSHAYSDPSSQTLVVTESVNSIRVSLMLANGVWVANAGVSDLEFILQQDGTILLLICRQRVTRG